MLVRDRARSGIWHDHRCVLNHDELVSLIRAAGGVNCDHALIARTLLAGGIELVDGIHRWAVAVEIGIDVVPVEMTVETESAWAWPPGKLS